MLATVRVFPFIIALVLPTLAVAQVVTGGVGSRDALVIPVVRDDSSGARVLEGGGGEGEISTLYAQCLRVFDGVAPKKSFGCRGRFSYTESTRDRLNDALEGFDFGRSVLLTFGDDRATLGADIASDDFWVSAGVGYMRVGVATTVVSGSAEATQETLEGDARQDEGTLEQLFQSPGNASIYFALPVWYFRNLVRDGPVGDSSAVYRPTRRLDVTAVGSVGADIPALNAAAQATATNARLGFRASGDWGGEERELGLFFLSEASAVVGFDEDFYSNLGTERGNIDCWPVKSCGVVGLLQLTAGVTIRDQILIGGTLGTSNAGDLPLRVSVAVLNF